MCHSLSGIASRLAFVSIVVGRITLQRIPCGAPSAATALAKAITAAFEDVYPAPPANGASADAAPVQTIEPPPACLRCGSTACVAR